MAALLKSGKKVLMPFGDNCRYDLVVEDDGSFTRINARPGKYRVVPLYSRSLPRNTIVEESVRITEGRSMLSAFFVPTMERST